MMKKKVEILKIMINNLIIYTVEADYTSGMTTYIICCSLSSKTRVSNVFAIDKLKGILGNKFSFNKMLTAMRWLNKFYDVKLYQTTLW